ncbi:MAG: hypothetical protein H6Q92_1968 [Nitrospirae bacterium]|nr:hypothetical protein [Nitrospirota bacterium]
MANNRLVTNRTCLDIQWRGQSKGKMLRFQETPDKIFIEILKAGMEIVIDEITDLIDYSENPKEAKSELRGILPLAARVFSPGVALKTLRDMREKLLHPELYYLNDFHYLLIYDTLQLYSELHNDMVRTARSKNEKNAAAKIGPYHIEKIDFDCLETLYFYDTDFLFDPEVMLSLGEEERKDMSFNPETFAITQGLAPHPEELVLKEVTEETYEVPEISQYFGPDSRCYPDEDMRCA